MQFNTILILIFTIATFVTPPALAADCTVASTGATRPEGSMIYNADHKTVQFCNGTEWIAARGFPGPTGPAGDVPSGAVMAFDLAACPDGWSALAGAAGRVVIGVGTLGSDTYALNDAGGEARHTLTAAEMPAHVHSVDPPSTSTNTTGAHSHRYTSRGDAGSSDGLSAKTHTSNSTRTSTDGAHAHAVDIPAFNSGSTGGGAAHENRPPYLALLYCRKD